ncbi:MAG: restriction endonuclease subunit S [Candidatus Poribacteria bacterium]|nr:restriction endonuclease subunit S [Candidatus Poribacteria bacterium]
MKRYPELIHQVMTKGLNPNVEMKPSGVEWIGEIPAHWEVKRLKHIAKILPSNVDKHIYSDEIQVRLCNYTDVYYNDYITVNTVLQRGSCKEREFAKFVLRKGDVIITKDSETPDDIGVPTFVKDNLENVVCGYHLTLIRPYGCRGEFIFRFIQSDRTRRYFELNSNGITRYGLGKSSIENLLLPIPSDSEQRQIANFLDHKTQQIDDLTVAEQRKIELLKEYRQSLISEAVTGKIDVRDEV